MKKMSPILIHTFIILGTLILSQSCATKKVITDEVSYYQKTLEWRQNRLTSMQGPENYPTLAGLYWLERGSHFVGSSEESSILFPPKAPPQIGVVTFDEGEVTYKINDGVQVTLDGKQTTAGVLWNEKKGIDNKLQSGSLIWYAIKRGEKHAIRLKDTLHENRLKLTQIPAYPIDHKWVKKGKFIAADKDATMMIDNQVGLTYPFKLAGWIEFDHANKTHRLTALLNSANDYFVILSDETSGVETYGGGRFMYPPKADEKGRTILDFNKAISPPCVFTDFATCPLPPKENHLPFQVTAGEKVEGH